MKSRREKPRIPQENEQCQVCGSKYFKTKITTFPFPIPFGRTIDVKNVPVQECQKCHEMIPTLEGRMKLARCLATFMLLPR